MELNINLYIFLLVNFRVGNMIGSHPWKAALLSLFVVGIFAAGIAKFEESSDRDTLWVPKDSYVYKYKNWVDGNFETTTHFFSVIFVDSNILTPSKLQVVRCYIYSTILNTFLH